MKSILLLVLCCVLVASAIEIDVAAEVERERAFINFQRTHSKTYGVKEYAVRKQNFMNNLNIIAELNQANPLATFGVNKFADMSADEFASQYLMKSYVAPQLHQEVGAVKVDMLRDIPTNYDWNQHVPNPISPVKDQGQCGSCWAFSATEEIESAWVLSGHNLTILSEQQIVDCDKTDQGCNGGDTTTAYTFVQKAGGLEEEKSYPYVAKDQKCKFNSSEIAVTFKSWKYATQTKNETEMLYALAQVAPISICVDASSWQNYQSGIITKKCGKSLDHCVQLTGYGQTTDATPVLFWNVRNSWNTDWGEKGYIRIERGEDLCGIAYEATIVF